MTRKEEKFVEEVWKYYERHGRHSLPWRKTKNAYRILVSEIMLQQTQVDRVLPKYTAFIKRFPSLQVLAKASLGDVLREWQGLGYNRRAKMLHQCAQSVVQEYKGRLPSTQNELMKLPGIGHYTAGAVMAFAFQESVPIIETNIRTVFIHHFFHDDTDVCDTDIQKYVARTLDIENPREWYYALMDYGAFLKKTIGNQNSRSRHYTKQSTFKNSDRQIRGAILRLLATQNYSRIEMHKALPYEIDRIDAQCEKLLSEGLIVLCKKQFALPE